MMLRGRKLSSPEQDASVEMSGQGTADVEKWIEQVGAANEANPGAEPATLSPVDKAPSIKQGSVTELEKAPTIMPEGSNKSRSHGSQVQQAQSQGGFLDVRSSVSCSSAGSNSKARVDLALAEKRVELLRRAKERKLREFALKLDNEEAEARDEAELAEIRCSLLEGSTKGSVVEQPRSTAKPLDGHLGGRIVRLKSDDPSEQSCPVDQRRLTAAALDAWTASVPDAPSVTSRDVVDSAPSTAKPLDGHLEEVVRTKLEVDQPVQQPPPGNGGLTATALDALSARLNLPPLEVRKFNGNPADYSRFIQRFTDLVESQALSQQQKMSRLLQFLDGQPRKAVAGFEGLPGGLHKALDVLRRRYGQPHMVTNACINSLVEGSPINKNDHQALQEFADQARCAYETLKSMDALSEANTSIHLVKIVTKLPAVDQAKWRDRVQTLRAAGQQPGLKHIVEFVERRAEALNDPIFGALTLPTSAPASAAKARQAPSPARVTTMATAVENGGEKLLSCIECRKAHSLESCPAFGKKTIEERRRFVLNKRVCMNCLRRGHFSAACWKKRRCESCGEKHHPLLHQSDSTSAKAPTPAQATAPAPSGDSSAAPSSRTVFRTACDDKKVALQIVPINVTAGGKSATTLGLLDPGSEGTFVSKALAERLAAKPKASERITLSTITGESTVNLPKLDLLLQPDNCRGTPELVPVNARVLTTLNIEVDPAINARKWPHLVDIDLPATTGDVEILVGADVPEAHLQLETRIGRRGEPYAVKSIFGWTLMGPTDGARASERPLSINFAQCDAALNHQVERYFNMDTMDADHGLAKDLSVEDRRARAKLEADARIVDGRYEVPMLWKTDTPWLPDNRPMAERRLASLERKLRKDEGLHVEYSKCIRQLVEKGYAEKIEEDDQPQAGRTWYLPHHAVKHPKKGKVRVVFDAAANYKGVSLNTQLVQGPDLTNNLLGVLLRFRERKTAIVADIEAMFHQVRVAPEDADALRFLWWEDGNVDTPPATYKMLRHIFGATDSPCCANFALQKTADDNRTAFPLETAETVKPDFYVDDLLKSVDNTASAIQLARDLRELLSRGGGPGSEDLNAASVAARLGVG